MEKQERQDNYTHILKTTGLFGGVQVITILISIVRTKLVAVLLGPQGMGLMSLFNSTTKVLGDSTGFGIPMSGVREISDAYENGDEEKVRCSAGVVRTWCFITALLGMVLCLVLSPLLNRWVFTWGDHTLHFILLAPVVGMTAITGGELAILKGLRQLRHLAAISVYNVFLTLILTVPLFYYFHEAAIVPSLILVAFTQMIVTIASSYKICPPRLSFSKITILRGVDMVKLGIAFVIAGIINSGTDFAIRSFFNVHADLAVVGLFSAAYTVIMVYGSMVFSAMETDYFPRLSAVKGTGEKLNDTVNKQIEVTLLLISPMLVALIVSLPILVPLLYSSKFLPIIPLLQVGILALYLRAVKLPIAYISLSKGDSLTFLIIESIACISMLVFVVLGYLCNGLRGSGWGLLTASAVEFVVLLVYARCKYRYTFSNQVLRYIVMIYPLGILAFLNTYNDSVLNYWISGIALFVVSLAISLNILRSKTNLWNTLKRKLLRRE